MLKVIRFLSLFILVIGLVGIFAPVPALAEDTTPTPTPTPEPPTIEMTVKYPKLEVNSGETAEFEIQLSLSGGDKPQVFDLVATAPKDWTVLITPSYPKDKKIASIQLTPDMGNETVLVSTTPAYWLQPNPGEYPVTLVATSGTIKGSSEVKAVVTAKYAVSMASVSQRNNTSATAGKDNYFSIDVQNYGSAAINDIALSSDKPEDWSVTYSPSKIDSLTSGNSQTVDVNIKPPQKAIAGDYLITLKAAGKQSTAQDLQIRVTVETPTIWGWVGVIIVVGVILGLALTFRQFSRR